jgi:hypothetical protein
MRRHLITAMKRLQDVDARMMSNQNPWRQTADRQ